MEFSANLQFLDTATPLCSLRWLAGKSPFIGDLPWIDQPCLTPLRSSPGLVLCIFSFLKAARLVYFVQHMSCWLWVKTLVPNPQNSQWMFIPLKLTVIGSDPQPEPNIIYPLVICYVAIENGHRNSGFSP